jgi:hypothetical protein
MASICPFFTKDFFEVHVTSPPRLIFGIFVTAINIEIIAVLRILR